MHLVWKPNNDNTKFHLEHNNANLYCTLSGGIWRIEVWLDDHKKIDCWAGRTNIIAAQQLAESLLSKYRVWMEQNLCN